MWMCYPVGKKTQNGASGSGSTLSCAKYSYDSQSVYSSPLPLMHLSSCFLEFLPTQVGIDTHFQTLFTFMYQGNSLVGSPHSPASCIDKVVSRIPKTFPILAIYFCIASYSKGWPLRRTINAYHLTVSVDGEFGSSSVGRFWFWGLLRGWIQDGGLGGGQPKRWLELDDPLVRQLAHVPD